MKFEIKGLDEFKRKLDDLERRAKEVEGEHSVPFEELFPPNFMKHRLFNHWGNDQIKRISSKSSGRF